MSCEIRPDPALSGLLHDAAEAYLGDFPSPLKRHLKEFKIFEAKMERVIAKAFGICPQILKCQELKRADVQLLVDEKAALMVAELEPWPPQAPAEKQPDRIKAWSPGKAKEEFLLRFSKLVQTDEPI